MAKVDLKVNPGRLLDFGARAYDPFTARWTSIDPLAHKYLGLSPYNYCGGNPVMYFDPDGLDIYTIDSDGNVNLYKKTDDKYDKMYADWGEGPLDENSAHVIVNDRSILKSMAQGNNPSGSSSRHDMRNIFKFAADTFNDQEWGLYYNNESYELTTKGASSEVSTSLIGVTWKVHSHPNTQANDKAEIESMGYWTFYDSAYDSSGKLLNINALWYESNYSKNDASNYIKSGIPSYVYFPVSGNTYKLTKHQLPYKTTLK